jgi:hypothetical protein
MPFVLIFARMKTLNHILLLAFVGIVLLGAGCFHKDVATCTADDIVATMLYDGPEGQFVIAKEEIFQASSKESSGGVTHISGSTEYRITSYKLATGEQAGRVALGDMIEEANALLGYSKGKVWMFSIDPEVGLHYRDPVTLEVKEAWPALSKKPGLGTLKLAQPDWPLISQYFAYDWLLQKLVLTDEAGFRYNLDPETFVLTLKEDKMPDVEWDEYVFSNSGQLQEKDRLYLQGDPRTEISFDGQTSGNGVSFLFGKWIIDPDPAKEAKRMVAKIDSLNARLKLLQDSLARFSAAYPEANAKPDYAKWTSEQRTHYNHAETIRHELETLRDEFKRLASFDRKVLDSPLLTNDHQSAFVRHANLVSDTAHIIVSRVNLQADNTWKIVWNTHLTSLYHDHSKADQAGVFEKVYSKGNPKFAYEWAGQWGDYMVLIAQLRMVCLNMKDGKILWEKEI